MRLQGSPGAAWLVAFAVALATPGLRAHPFSETEYSLKTEMLADDRGVHLQASLEVPIAVVLDGLSGVRGITDRSAREAAVRADEERRIAELAGQAAVLLDGRLLEVAFVRADTLVNGKAADGFFVYIVEARVAAARIGEGSRLQVVHRGYGDVPMVFAAEGGARKGFTVVDDEPARVRRASCEDGTCAATEGFARDPRLKSPTWVLSRGSSAEAHMPR